MLRLHLPHPSPFTLPRFNHTTHKYKNSLPPRNQTQPPTTLISNSQNTVTLAANPIQVQQGSARGKSFWGAVSLIIGTAVGPGMLGLPAATIKSGPFPSTVVILFSWVYVVSSILLVAELTFAAMEDEGIGEVSFTSLATKAFGDWFGAFVALVYASLSFSLLVACVSGIGSIVSQWFPRINNLILNALFPLTFGTLIALFPFKVIDTANRILCFMMLFSISALVGIGLFVARTNVTSSFAHSSWSLSKILPAIPVTVLTLGFHVITPFICKFAGNTVIEARKAILVGGIVPLVMVLSWNLIVLGLAGANKEAASLDPIPLLLSVNPSALPAVQGFAFSALATSLIGYAVSFPKQLLDTSQLIFGKKELDRERSSQSLIGHEEHGKGKVGMIVYLGKRATGNPGKVFFGGSTVVAPSGAKMKLSKPAFYPFQVTLLVLGPAVLIASFFPSTFSKALDFAGIYANCFLFGILPPAMAYINQPRRRLRSSSILPGGNGALQLLFVISVMLGIWH